MDFLGGAPLKRPFVLQPTRASVAIVKKVGDHRGLGVAVVNRGCGIKEVANACGELAPPESAVGVLKV